MDILLAAVLSRTQRNVAGKDKKVVQYVHFWVRAKRGHDTLQKYRGTGTRASTLLKLVQRYRTFKLKVPR